MSKWYDDWVAKENDMPVNFGRYIGNIKGADPGATNAARILNDAHKEIKSKIKSMGSKTGEKDAKELENFLTNLYFPKNTGDSSSITNQFIKLVTEGYEKAYEDKINKESFNFSSPITRQGVGRNTFRKMLDNGVRKTVQIKERENAAFSTLKRQIDELNLLQQSLDEKALKNFDALKKSYSVKLNKMYTAYDVIIDLYKTATIGVDSSSEEDPRWEQLKTKMLISEGKITDVYNQDLKLTKANLKTTLQQFDTFYETAMQMFYVPSKVYGDIFEYSLSLLNFAVVPTEEDVASIVGFNINSSLKDAKKAKSAVKGSELIERNGNIHLLDFDVQLASDSSLNEKYNKEFIEFERPENEQIQYGNVLINIEADGGTINSGEAKQGKCDVIIQNPSIVKGREFRISAKNWSKVDDLHGLGNTSILRGLDRTSSVVDGSGKQEVLLNYIYAMQQPVEGERDQKDRPIARHKVANEAVNYGHRLAKESLILDIAMGFSQVSNGKNGQADTLIILDRSKKRVIVIDLISELKKFIERPNSATNLFIEGYNDDEITSAARTIRRAVREGASYVGRDRNYVNLMKAYLNGRKAEVKLNQKYY